MGIKEWFGAFTGASADAIRHVDPEVLADPVHIRVRDVHKYYGPHHVLKGLSFDIVRGKTNDRYRPIATALVPVLERMLARSEGKPTLVSSVKKIEKVFYFWKKKLGLQAFSTHVLRHGFVSDLLNQGAPPPVVASLVGHTSLRQLPRYYHASDPALIAAADALGQGRQRRSTPPPAGTSPDRPAPDS